jgi:hypothetical protein
VNAFARRWKHVATSLAIFISIAVQASPVEIPGTDGGIANQVNARGEVLWGRNNGDVFITRTAGGVFETVHLNADRPARAYHTGNFLSESGDALWTELAPVPPYGSLFHYSKSSGVTTRLTDNLESQYNAIAGNGNAVWSANGPTPYERNNLHVAYFDARTRISSVLTTAPIAYAGVGADKDGNAYWFEVNQSTGRTQLRKYLHATKATVVLSTRPTGNYYTTGSMQVSDFGDVAWSEVQATTGTSDAFLYRPRTNAVVRLSNNAAAEGAFRFNANGDLVYVAGATEVWRVSAYSGENKQIPQTQGNWMWVPAALTPAGNTIWTQMGGNDTDLIYYDVFSGESRVIVSRTAQPYDPIVSRSGVLYFRSATTGRIYYMREEFCSCTPQCP